MKVKKKSLILYGLISVASILIAAMLGSISILPCLILYIYIGIITESKSSAHMMFFLGYTTFLFLPALLNWYYLDTSFTLFYLSSLVAIIFLKTTNKTIVKDFKKYGAYPRVFFLLCCSIFVIFILMGKGREIESIFAFLIILLSLTFEQNKLFNNLKYLLIFLIVFFLYMFLAWSGFGRTVFVGYLILALLQFSYSISFKVNKYIFSLIPAFGASLLANRDLLKLEFTGFRSSLYDSAYSPYRLASTFIDTYNQRGYDIPGFWDQIIFTFFVFIPRSIWPNKPYGFGFEYTIRHLDTYLIEAGHSIASTLIGDHIYYLGYIGVLTSIVIILIIAWITNYLYSIKVLNGNGVILFSANMMVLNWGGMTSFSARVALPGIVFMILYLINKKFFKRKYRFIWGK